jgi:hypothetical protein
MCSSFKTFFHRKPVQYRKEKVDFDGDGDGEWAIFLRALNDNHDKETTKL